MTGATGAGNRSFDVVVLGGGLAGYCAALAAAETGARTALLEKADRIGGSTIVSGGSFAFGGTEDQKAAGIDDSPEMLRADLVKAGKGHSDPALIDAYVDHQLAVLAWLKGLGVEFMRVSLSSSQSAPRSHSVEPAQMMATLDARVRERPNVELLTGTAGRRLVTSGGKVTGVVAASGDGTEWVAHGQVVIATGGFVRNPEMIARFAPALRGIGGMGGAASHGDGISMALELGAGLRDTEFLKGTFGGILDRYPDTATGPDSTLLMTMYRGGIIVNPKAERFINESVSYKLIGDACLEQPGAVGFQIFDQSVMDQSVETPLLNNFRGAYERKLVRKADTIGGLAAALGLDPQTLERTVSDYNADVSAGADRRFGRATLSSTFGRPPALASGPFYGVPCTTVLIATYCGITVTPAMEVTHESGEPIPGLYAAGEVIGGFHGETYVSGASLAKSAIFGWLAGTGSARAALGRS